MSVDLAVVTGGEREREAGQTCNRFWLSHDSSVGHP
jgi:hypothetical protein